MTTIDVITVYFGLMSEQASDIVIFYRGEEKKKITLSVIISAFFSLSVTGSLLEVSAAFHCAGEYVL